MSGSGGGGGVGDDYDFKSFKAVITCFSRHVLESLIGTHMGSPTHDYICLKVEIAYGPKTSNYVLQS